MSELIDRQDVIARLKKAEDVFRRNGAKLEANGIHYALELVESDIEIPTVELQTGRMTNGYVIPISSTCSMTSGKVVPDNLQGWRYEERPQGDLISREALKKAICIDEPISIDETWEQLYDAVVKAIDNAPTFNPGGYESSYASKQRAYKEGKYDGFMKSPYGD